MVQSQNSQLKKELDLNGNYNHVLSSDLGILWQHTNGTLWQYTEEV